MLKKEEKRSKVVIKIRKGQRGGWKRSYKGAVSELEGEETLLRCD